MTENLDGDTVQGAWRALCAGMLAQAVEKARSESRPKEKKVRPHWFKKEEYAQRFHAKAWLTGGVGTITFEDCCEALGVDAERLRTKIAEYCEQCHRLPVTGRWKRRT